MTYLQSSMHQNSIIDLPDIIDHIKDGETCGWKLFIFEVVVSNSSRNIVKFENDVDNSSARYLIHWQKLKLLTDEIDQCINLILVGDKDIDQVKTIHNTLSANYRIWI